MMSRANNEAVFMPDPRLFQLLGVIAFLNVLHLVDYLL